MTVFKLIKKNQNHWKIEGQQTSKYWDPMQISKCYGQIPAGLKQHGSTEANSRIYSCGAKVSINITWAFLSKKACKKNESQHFIISDVTDPCWDLERK